MFRVVVDAMLLQQQPQFFGKRQSPVAPLLLSDGCGGIDRRNRVWKRKTGHWLFPQRALSKLFRGKLTDLVEQDGHSCREGPARPETPAKRPEKGPNAEYARNPLPSRVVHPYSSIRKNANFEARLSKVMPPSQPLS